MSRIYNLSLVMLSENPLLDIMMVFEESLEFVMECQVKIDESLSDHRHIAYAIGQAMSVSPSSFGEAYKLVS